jgi:hypothetical protein
MRENRGPHELKRRCGKFDDISAKITPWRHEWTDAEVLAAGMSSQAGRSRAPH